MDIVYIYGRPSPHIYESVRLAKKFVSPNIHIVGTNPNIPDTTFHPFPDINIHNWEANVIRKILFATCLPVSDPFLMMNDDIFITKPQELPLTYKYDLNTETSPTTYTQWCKNTVEELTRLKLPTLSYQTHRPTPIYKQEYQKAYQLVDWEQETRGILCLSIYGNYLKKGTLSTDAKSDYETLPLPLPVFSTPDNIPQSTWDYLSSI